MKLKIFTAITLALLITGCAVTKKAEPIPEETTSTIAIVVPADLEKYESAMTEYAQVGGANPLDTMDFTQKVLEIPETENVALATAAAAAAEIKIHGDQIPTVEYFEVQNETAYIQLNIDLDAWAGISVAIAKIRPLVEMSLLELPEVDSVVWGQKSE